MLQTGNRNFQFSQTNMYTLAHTHTHKIVCYSLTFTFDVQFCLGLHTRIDASSESGLYCGNLYFLQVKTSFGQLLPIRI